jgi:hypothetical protein
MSADEDQEIDGRQGWECCLVPILEGRNPVNPMGVCIVGVMLGRLIEKWKR